MPFSQAVLHHLAGQYALAEQLYLRAIAARATSLGARHIDVGKSLNNLASLYSEQGKYAQVDRGSIMKKPAMLLSQAA